ncbi:Phytochelatin synthase-domain-containing protein, partial [Tribonema minus]
MSVAVLRRGLLAQQRLQLRRFASLAASSCSSTDSDCVGGSSSSGAQISPPLPSANSSFYRRPLPASCVAFSSSEGKALFSEALKEGYMEAYFNLAEQFNTQDEPAYCGLSTLSMILNALEIDPGRTWKGPWRWYHESMLDCCVSLDDIKERGISYRELAGLARCNGAACTVRDAAAVSLEDFRRVVQHITGGGHGRAHLVINYDRRVLGQTGKGHFSPIGSYNSRHDMVLVMDTARFKYPPHWVPLETAWRAMRQIEETTGKGRGFMVFYRQERKGLVFTVCRPAQERWPAVSA